MGKRTFANIRSDCANDDQNHFSTPSWDIDKTFSSRKKDEDNQQTTHQPNQSQSSFSLSSDLTSPARVRTPTTGCPTFSRMQRASSALPACRVSPRSCARWTQRLLTRSSALPTRFRRLSSRNSTRRPSALFVWSRRSSPP